MIQKFGKNIVLIGTAHISHKSVREVRSAIEKESPDVVAVELDRSRYLALTQKEKWRNTSVIRAIRDGKGTLMLVQIFLGTIQRQLGLKDKAKPGMEMMAAIIEARRKEIPIALVDRNIGITFRRGWKNMGFFEKIRLFWYGLYSILGGEDPNEMEIDIDGMLKEDMITAMIKELKEFAPGIGEAFIDERDTYIAQRLLSLSTGEEGVIYSTDKPLKRVGKGKGRTSNKKIKQVKTGRIPAKPISRSTDDTPRPDQNTKEKKVLAVLGAGHLNGVKTNLESGKVEGVIESLEKVKKKRFSIGGILKYSFPALFFLLAAYLVWQGDYGKLGKVFFWWVLINGTLSALGTLVARGHPLSILTAFVAAPLTSLNPLLAAGWFAGLVEGNLRPPRVADIEALSSIKRFRDFFKNPLVRLLMVVALANLGSVIGTYVATGKIIEILL